MDGAFAQFDQTSADPSYFDPMTTHMAEATASMDLHHFWYKSLLFFLASPDDVKEVDWKFEEDKGELKVKFEFKAEELFGKDSGLTFADLDTTLIEDAFSELGASETKINKLEIKDNEIRFEMVGKGISATQEEVAELFDVIPVGATVSDADGNLSEIALFLGEDPNAINALSQTDLTPMAEGYVAYQDASTEDSAVFDETSGDYAPLIDKQAVIDTFLDFNTDRDVPDKLIMTEDVWFGEAPDDYKLCKSSEFLDKMEWDYSRGGETLKLQVDFDPQGLFGENTEDLITEVDISDVEKIMSDLGATSITVSKLELKDDRIQIEIEGEGIDITDEEVYALPGSVNFGLTVLEADGDVEEVGLDLCVKDFDPHSPVTFDLNWSGAIETTGNSTAQVRDDATIGKTVSFDIDADGTDDQIEWLDGSGDALLVDNRDGQAMENMDGSRLFGDEGGKYANGYEKMSILLDTNQDGVLSGDELNGLELWQDDGDAVAEEGEFINAQEYGISEIATGYYVDDMTGEELMRSLAVIEGSDNDPAPDPEDEPQEDWPFEILG